MPLAGISTFATAVAGHGWRQTGSWFLPDLPVPLISRRGKSPPSNRIRSVTSVVSPLMRVGIPLASKCVTATCSSHTSPRPSGRRNRNVIECERSSGPAMFKRVVTDGRSSGWICLTHSALLRDCLGPRPRISAAFWLSRIRPMRRSQSKVITPPARSASSSRRSLSRIASSCVRRSLNSAARTSAPNEVARMVA